MVSRGYQSEMSAICNWRILFFSFSIVYRFAHTHIHAHTGTNHTDTMEKHTSFTSVLIRLHTIFLFFFFLKRHLSMPSKHRNLLLSSWYVIVYGEPLRNLQIHTCAFLNYRCPMPTMNIIPLLFGVLRIFYCENERFFFFWNEDSELLTICLVFMDDLETNKRLVILFIGEWNGTRNDLRNTNVRMCKSLLAQHNIRFVRHRYGNMY